MCKALQFIRRINSPLGKMILVSDGKALTGLWFEGQKHCPAVPEAAEVKLPLFERTEAWLNDYFAGKRRRPCELPLSARGTPFRQMIWAMLCEIPYGETVTYGELARKAAEKMNCASMSAQAVGGAVGYNPISIIIPCHRVVGSSGALTGYAGGLERKAQLLALEKIVSRVEQHEK